MLCDSRDGISEAYNAGAVGLIYANDRAGDVSFVVPLPAVALENDTYTYVLDYIRRSPRYVRINAIYISVLNSNTNARFSSNGMKYYSIMCSPIHNSIF